MTTRTTVVIILLAATLAPAYAQRSPWIRLSAANMRAVGLRLATTRRRVLHERHTLYGYFVLPPGATATVTPRIRGRVTALYATIGDRVHRGAPLARIESLLVGTPPPSVIVHAPLTSVVETRPAILGEVVAPGTLLYRLIKPRVLWLKAYVYQNEIDAIHRGQPVRIRALGISDTMHGRIVMISPRINPRRGAETIWIAITGPHAPLKPALFARALVTVATVDAPTVPSAAVLDVDGHEAVFVATGGGRFHYTPITVGIREGQYVAIPHLAPGTRVVTQGNTELYTLWATGGKLRADS
ncbi:MAG: efflux RND transporter periplasmic adaptor subunit [Acidiferrobacter sp.]